MERGAKERNHQLYKPYTNGKTGSGPFPHAPFEVCSWVLDSHTGSSLCHRWAVYLSIFHTLSPSTLLDGVFSFAGIIAKDPTSLEEEIKEIRRSGSSKALDNTPEFELSDIFYFCRKGMETIMDDEVTKRFSAEELESWNLLSRTNYNFQYISLRLTILWGLGVLIRYCFLLPLR